MEVLFETRKSIVHQKGNLTFFQGKPEIYPQPMVIPDTFVDGDGCSIYGSVFKDGGKFRMWYQAMPEDRKKSVDIAGVAYAESDDGINWKKPELDLVEYGKGKNHLTNLGLHCPSIWIDPQAPSDKRYRATGFGNKNLWLANKDIGDVGYYTAYSADGLDWKLDPGPRWEGADVISSTYHGGRGCGVVALKIMPWVAGLRRRAIYTSDLTGDNHTSPTIGLMPDEYTDISAINRGFNSGDYYGMGMQPAGREGMIGFLWNFWHNLPYINGPFGMYGDSDISLIYQDSPGEPWQHVRGRPDFISRKDMPAASSWMNSSSCPVEHGDEHRLYFSSTPHSHAWNRLIDDEELRKEIVAKDPRENKIRIYMASWKKWRLFGCRAEAEAILTVEVKNLDKPCRLKLNYETSGDGYIKTGILDSVTQKYIEGRGFDESNSLPDDEACKAISWKDSDIILPVAKHPIHLQFKMSNATIYAYELEEV